MKKRFKKRKKVSFKFIVYVLFICLFYYLFRFYILNIGLVKGNSNFVKMMIEDNNYYSYYKGENVLNRVKKYLVSKIEPITLINTKNDSNTIFIYNESKGNKNIYLYSSHQWEGYDSKYLSDYNITPDVLMASHMLEEKLEKKGINTVVEESDIKGYMKEKGMNSSLSYKASRMFLENFYIKNPDYDLYIDIHRDSVAHDLSVVNINNKVCAKVLFVIGLENDNYQKNLDKVNTINSIINKKYSGLSRGIMKKKGVGVNGVYNQDLDERVILLEVGGNENTIEEVNNTLDLISNVLEEYLNEKQNV